MSTALPPLSPGAGFGRPFGTSGLGSLAQSARARSLKIARRLLIAVGIFTLAVNIGLIFTAKRQVDRRVAGEVAKLQAKGLDVDSAIVARESEKALGIARLIHGATAALGVAFVLLGLLIKTFPVPVTILGLVLYIGATAVFAVLNPASLLSGLPFKILIIFVLGKSTQAAIAYQRATALAAEPAAAGLRAGL
jgi:hypothetical protein